MTYDEDVHVAASCIFVLFVGCSGPQTTVQASPPASNHTETISETIALADTIYRTSRQQSKLLHARNALRAAIDAHDHPYELLWRLARNNVHLVLIDKRHAAQWAEEGRSSDEQASQKEPKRVEGLLYQAICTSLLAQERPSDSQPLIKATMQHAKRAIVIDRSYGEGAALRLLGGLLIYAPAWPTSVGDLEEGIEVLEALLVQYSHDPIGTFLLAEAYRKADQTNDAKRLYERVLSFRARGLWRIEGPPYRKRARQALKDLERVP